MRRPLKSGREDAGQSRATIPAGWGFLSKNLAGTPYIYSETKLPCHLESGNYNFTDKTKLRSH
jgi:hypothetical protein